ncbi:hypothetical protein KSS87_009852 [Heliosperma pusillum]|nr:hypothetical protein KSS87_009852 [Heliosperma pusillum]
MSTAYMKAWKSYPPYEGTRIVFNSRFAKPSMSGISGEDEGIVHNSTSLRQQYLRTAYPLTMVDSKKDDDEVVVEKAKKGSSGVSIVSMFRKMLACTSKAEASSCSANSRRISSLESLFCYDKPVPEQIIEKPVGLSVAAKEIGDHAGCSDCQAKGAVLCTTCGGSGLYVDSVMECQGIIVKVRCLGCGGTGNIMCSECGGRGHM